MIDRRDMLTYTQTRTRIKTHTNTHTQTRNHTNTHSKQTIPHPHTQTNKHTQTSNYISTQTNTKNKHTRALDKTAALAKDSHDVYSADLGTDTRLGIESFFSVIYIRLFSFFSCLMSIILCIIISAVFYHIQDPNTLEYPIESSR